MKKSIILTIIFSCLLAVFNACSDSEDEITKAFLEVSPTSLDFPAAGATRTVTVKSSNLEWNFSCEADWCKVERSENQLEITVDPYNDLELRTTKIVVKAKDVEDQVINIRQSAAAEATLVIIPETLSEFVAKNPEAQTLAVETNQSKVSISSNAADWCEVVISDDCTEITVTPQTNVEIEDRTTSFTIQAGEDSNTKEMTFEVKQKAASLVIVDKIELNEIGYPIFVAVNAEAESYTYAVGEGAKWCTVEATEGGILVSAPGYKEEGERKTTVSISMNGDVKATIAVTQIGGELKLHDEYYYNGQLIGIVVRVTHPYEIFGMPDYTQIWVMALEEKKDVQWSVDAAANVGLNVVTTGVSTWAKIKAQPDWQNKFPAFAYCAEMEAKTGMLNWTLGYHDDMYYFFRDENGKDERSKQLNNRLEELGGMPLDGFYWSNTEASDFNTEAGNPTIQGFWVHANGGLFVSKWFGKDEKWNARCIWSGNYDYSNSTKRQ